MPLTYKEMQDLLMRELRLYHFPIAINFHKTQADVEEFKKKARYVEPVKPITYCQWEITARMQGQTVLATKEKLGCTNSQVSFGWKDIDEAEIKSQSKYCKDLAQAERFLRSKPRLPLNSIVAVSVGPLADAVMQPDVVHFYCDNLQSYHLAVDYMAGTDTHPLRPMVTMSSSACGGSVFTHLEQSMNMCPACSGSYNAGKTERGELNVFIPGAHIGPTVDRLMERIAKTGAASISRPGDPFPGADICKNCPLIIFKKSGSEPEACASCSKA